MDSQDKLKNALVASSILGGGVTGAGLGLKSYVHAKNVKDLAGVKDAIMLDVDPIKAYKRFRDMGRATPKLRKINSVGQSMKYTGLGIVGASLLAAAVNSLVKNGVKNVTEEKA